MSRNTLIALWAFVGVFALAAVLLLVWYSHSTHQAKIAAANDRLSQAVSTANEWMAGKSTVDGESVEQQLTDALKNNDATDRGSGESVLSQVRRRREHTRIEQAQRQATVVFEDAKRRLDGKDVAQAIALLRKCVADPHATQRTEAQRLLAEADTAVSDMFTLDALIAMSDDEFDAVQAGGEVRDGKVTHPVLLTVRNETVQRNLEKAVQRRAEIKITEEKRREAERLAAIERQRQEQERQRAAEAARLAEERRRQAEIEAKLAAIRNAPSVSFKDLTNFPEDYIGKHVKIESAWFHGDLDRQREAGVFSVGVSSSDGKYVSNILLRGELKFVVSEDFGRSLDLLFEADKKTGTNLYCEIVKLNDYLVGRLYRIETLNLSGNVLNAYEDKGAIGSAEPSKDPVALANKGTKENPAAVNFKDLVNFPEDYMGGVVKLDSVWLHGGFEREKEAGVFCVGVSSKDGKYVSNVFFGRELRFVVSEAYGRGLDLEFEDDKKTGTNLYCEISRIGSTPVAKIYRVETLNLAGNVLNTFDDK